MAVQNEGGGKDELKTQFIIREGTYRVMTLSEYTRPNRTVFNGQANTPVKTSFISLKDHSGAGDRICFNIGRELFFYVYKGVRKAADLTKPIDKRTYKGTFPTCHDFNEFTASVDNVMLLVGFTAGQVQLIDPIKKELSKLYNEERLIDKTKVTCITWLPASPNQFLVAHGSGHMYVYNEDLPCGATAPHYQTFKQGDGYTVYTCKTKSTRNPLYRWVVGDGCVNQFAFSPCSRYLAVVSQDGYLRVFDFNAMELVGVMKSYFGGLLCCAWSPDGKYIVTGGEDDLVTVWSTTDKRVVCRGQGHNSWVNMVAFDPFTTTGEESVNDCMGSDDDIQQPPMHGSVRSNPSLLHETLRASTRSNQSKTSKMSGESKGLTSYRFGSVGQDTQLCLWDLTEDVMRQPLARHRTSALIVPMATNNNAVATGNSTLRSTSQSNSAYSTLTSTAAAQDGHVATISTSLTHKFATLALGEHRKDEQSGAVATATTAAKKEHKRNFSLGNRKSDKHVAQANNHVNTVDQALRLLGTPACPRLEEVPLLEPLICKKIANERLTSLVFRDECFVTACQEGFVHTWARPGKVGLSQQHALGNTVASSPHQSANSLHGPGTIV